MRFARCMVVLLHQGVQQSGLHQPGGRRRRLLRCWRFGGTVLSARWIIRSAPGSYVFTISGSSVRSAFYAPGVYVIVYAVTLEDPNGEFEVDSEIDWSVRGPGAG